MDGWIDGGEEETERLQLWGGGGNWKVLLISSSTVLIVAANGKFQCFFSPPPPRNAVVSVSATCEGWLKNGARHLKTIPELHQNKPAHDFRPGWEIKFVFAVYYRRLIRRKDSLWAWRTSSPQRPGPYLWNLRRVHFPTEEDGKTEDFFGDNLSGALNAKKKRKKKEKKKKGR